MVGKIVANVFFFLFSVFTAIIPAHAAEKPTAIAQISGQWKSPESKGSGISFMADFNFKPDGSCSMRAVQGDWDSGAQAGSCTIKGEAIHFISDEMKEVIDMNPTAAEEIAVKYSIIAYSGDTMELKDEHYTYKLSKLSAQKR